MITRTFKRINLAPGWSRGRSLSLEMLVEGLTPSYSIVFFYLEIPLFSLCVHLWWERNRQTDKQTDRQTDIQTQKAISVGKGKATKLSTTLRVAIIIKACIHFRRVLRRTSIVMSRYGGLIRSSGFTPVSTAPFFSRGAAVCIRGFAWHIVASEHWIY